MLHRFTDFPDTLGKPGVHPGKASGQTCRSMAFERIGLWNRDCGQGILIAHVRSTVESKSSMRTQVRDWGSILPESITLKNAFRARKWTGEEKAGLPHSFVYMPRAGCWESCVCLSLAGLPNQGDELSLHDRVPRALRRDERVHDTFALVKEYMHHVTLSQDPLLVLPTATLERSQAFLRDANSASCPTVSYHLEKERIEELKVLRHGISVDFPDMRKTLAWYDMMINQRPGPRSRIPRLTFFERSSVEYRRHLGAIGLGAKPVAPRPQELQVVFHRGG